MATVILYGDTVRYAAIRHEVPLEIVDPFLLVARDGDARVLTNALEVARLREALPVRHAELRVGDDGVRLLDEAAGPAELPS